MNPLFLDQIATYKSEAYYAVVHDWTCTTLASRQLSVVISSNMLASLLSSISLMFLNDLRFASDGIAMLSLFLTYLNPSSRKNLLLKISDLTCLEMRLGKSSIDYMSRVRGISQRTQGINIGRIIPLFAIVNFDHDRYPGVKSCYLTGDSVMVNCNLLKLSGLLYSKETGHHTLGILSALQYTTTANCVSNTPTNSPPDRIPGPQPPQPPT